MSATWQPAPAARRHRFTLVEMLAVLAIVAIIMGIVVGAVRTSTGVNASAQRVSRLLHLARQYAISHRVNVAVLLPDTNITGSGKAVYSQDFFRKSYRACVVTLDSSGNATFSHFIDGSDWQFTDKAVVFQAAGNTDTCDGAIPFYDEASAPTFSNFECIIFRPTGSLTRVNDATLTLGPDAGSPDGRVVTLNVNWLTGKVDFNASNN